ncbi:hypothetical protein M9H77_30828 [Catharanthus roseus]|uniref:Uncharacterized protein n=1 Tax=Catharanthus roseus TaxID=4058 RepID=A0ACC0A290_CATRO|nr:hypothetical protein M9H77_30828 [Catharanthus roseus]
MINSGGTSNRGANATSVHASNESLEISSPSQLEDVSHLDTSGDLSNPNSNDGPSQRRNRRGKSSGKAIEKRICENALRDHFNIGLYSLVELESLSSTMLYSRTSIVMMMLLKVKKTNFTFNFKGWDTNKQVKGHVDDILKIGFRHWRNQLHKDYKSLLAATKSPRTNCPYKFINQDAWNLCVIRLKVPILRGGSIPFHARFAEMDPSYIKHFDVTHKKANREYVNEKAKSTHRQHIENGEPVKVGEILAVHSQKEMDM